MSDMEKLVGIGLYTPAEASRLSGIPAQRLQRWLQGHRQGATEYLPLWRSQIDLGDARTYLGFRDLMEARVANRFIELGISAIRVRQAILLAREVLNADHPLSTSRFRTDGRNIFLQTVETEADGKDRDQLLNLFRRQYEFSLIIEPLLKDVEFDGFGAPSAWWPLGQAKKIIIDPARAFGQPIDSDSSVPIAILANAAKHHGIDAAAKSYDVPKAAIRRAMAFAGIRELQRAA